MLISSGQARPGQTFDVICGLSGVEQEMIAQDMTLQYDSASLEFVGAQSLDENFYQIVDYTETDGELRFLGVHLGEGQQDPNAELMGITFRVKANAEPGCIQLSVTRLIAADSEGVPGIAHGVHVLEQGDFFFRLLTNVHVY